MSAHAPLASWLVPQLSNLFARSPPWGFPELGDEDQDDHLFASCASSSSSAWACKPGAAGAAQPPPDGPPPLLPAAGPAGAGGTPRRPSSCAPRHGPDKAPPRLRNVGPREALPSLIAEFSHNPSFTEKVQRLEQRGYTGWRRVRGDGNCYYRSVGFGLLEQLVVATGPKRLAYAASLRERLATLSFADASKAAAHEDLLLCVERLQCGGGWEQPSRADAEMTAFGLLYRSLQNPEHTADLALIRALRQLTAAYITAHAYDEAANNGISFHDLCVCGGEFENVEDFCNQVVLPDGRDAETLCQQALPAALGVAVRIAFLDRNEAKDVHFIDFGLPQDADVAEPLERPLVHVQLRPGHYDLLYFREGTPPGASGRAASAPPLSPEQNQRAPRPPTLGSEDFGAECEIIPPPPQRSRGRSSSARRRKQGLCL